MTDEGEYRIKITRTPIDNIFHGMIIKNLTNEIVYRYDSVYGEVVNALLENLVERLNKN